VEAGLNIRCEKTLQLGGSHDHPITLHIRSGAAFGNDVGLAGVPRSNTSHQSSGAGAGIVNFQSIPGDEENGLVLVRRDADNQP